MRNAAWLCTFTSTIAAAAVVSMVGLAKAAPTYSFDEVLDSNLGTNEHFGGSGPASILDTESFISTAGGGPLGGEAVALGSEALSAYGLLGAAGGVSAISPTGGASGVVVTTVGMELDNILITGTLPPGTPVKYSINFGIDGVIVLKAAGNSAAFGDVVVNYAPHPLAFGTVELGEISADTDPTFPSNASGIFAGPPLGPAIVSASTPVLDATIGQTVTASFKIGTEAIANAMPSPTMLGEASSNVNFTDPFSFPSSSVFNFFDAVTGAPLTGVTVNSSDGCIVNNQFLCSASSATVSEPSGLVILLVAIAALGLAGAWRRDKSLFFQDLNGKERIFSLGDPNRGGDAEVVILVRASSEHARLRRLA